MKNNKAIGPTLYAEHLSSVGCKRLENTRLEQTKSKKAILRLVFALRSKI